MTEYYDEFYDENGNALYQNTFFHNETIDLMELVSNLNVAALQIPAEQTPKIIFEHEVDQDDIPCFTMRVFYQKPKLTKDQVDDLLREADTIKSKLKVLAKIRNQQKLTEFEELAQDELGKKLRRIRLELEKPHKDN